MSERAVGRGIWALALLVASALPARAAAAAPAQEGSLLGRAEEELEAWNIEGAAAILEQMTAQDPQSPQTLWLRGRVLFEQGKYAEADQAFGEAEQKGDANLGQDRKLARAAADEVRGASVHESAHFILKTKADKDALLAPYLLDALEHAYAALTKDLGYAPPNKVRVEVYDSAQALARVSPLSVAEIKASGTIALCKYNRLMITSPRALLRGYPWLDTVSHEFVHYLVTRKGRGTVPIWLQEGLAKFLETRWRGEPGLSDDDQSLALLTRAAKTNTLIPFAAMHPSIAKLPTQEKAQLAFAEVEAAVRLLYLRGGQAALTELVAAMGNGFTDEQAVAQAYGKSFPQFEADWRADVAKPREAKVPAALLATGAAKIVRPAAAHRLVFKDDAKRGDDSPAGAAPDVSAEPGSAEAKRAVRLAELMLARHRFGAAAVEYGRARRLILPSHLPVVERRYAFAEIQLGKFPEAEEALQIATRSDPSDETAQVLLASVLLERADTAGAGAALEQAVAEDPFDPALHLAWLKLAKKLNDPKLEAREQNALALCMGRTPSEGFQAATKGTP